MKRIGLGMVIVGLLFAANPASAGRTTIVTSIGQVVSVDAKAKAMVVKFENKPGRANDIPFAVNRHTKVTKAGHRVGVAGIAAGDEITVTFQTVNGKNVAVNVGIESKSAA